MTSDTDPTLPPPVDLEHLRRYTMGDERLEQEILGLFVTHAPQTLSVLRDSQNATEWRAAAHGIKGSARAVGAHHVAELAGKAEAAYPEVLDARLAQLAALDDAVAVVVRFVSSLGSDADGRSA